MKKSIPILIALVVVLGLSYTVLNLDDIKGRFTSPGSPMPVISSDLGIAIASSPVSATYSAGSSDVELLGITFSCKSAKEGCKITDILIQGYLDDAGASAFSTTKTGTTHGTSLDDYIDEIALIDSAGTIVETAHVNPSTFTATFDSLDIEINPGTSETYTLVGDLSETCFANDDAESIAFGISAGGSVIAEYYPSGTSVTVRGRANTKQTVVITTSL